MINRADLLRLLHAGADDCAQFVGFEQNILSDEDLQIDEDIGETPLQPPPLDEAGFAINKLPVIELLMVQTEPIESSKLGSQISVPLMSVDDALKEPWRSEPTPAPRLQSKSLVEHCKTPVASRKLDLLSIRKTLELGKFPSVWPRQQLLRHSGRVGVIKDDAAYTVDVFLEYQQLERGLAECFGKEQLLTIQASDWLSWSTSTRQGYYQQCDQWVLLGCFGAETFQPPSAPWQQAIDEISAHGPMMVILPWQCSNPRPYFYAIDPRRPLYQQGLSHYLLIALAQLPPLWPYFQRVLINLVGGSLADLIWLKQHTGVSTRGQSIELISSERAKWLARLDTLPASYQQALAALREAINHNFSPAMAELNNAIALEQAIDIQRHPALYTVLQDIERSMAKGEAGKEYQWIERFNHPRYRSSLPVAVKQMVEQYVLKQASGLVHRGGASGHFKYWQHGQNLRIAPSTASDAIEGPLYWEEGCRMLRAEEALPLGASVTLRNLHQRWRFSTLSTPPWAARFWQNEEGIYAEHQSGLRFLVSFNDDEQHWQHQPQKTDPQWVAQTGVDQFGLWAEFTLKGVTQRMRWICPGQFLMGSPEDEPERYGDETLHPVTITQGYWLADTACTQALWTAVMGNNPSHFSGDSELPVEQITYDDCEAFFDAINRNLNDLKLRFVTEAEYEFAARSGRQTAFWWGDTLSTDQANFSGKKPYNGAAKQKWRIRTLPVKTFDPNPNGLYQVHGNVFSWCQDWYGDYPSAPVADPEGPSSGSFRVLRGGSWSNFGRNLRAADRTHGTPHDRYHGIGLRFAGGDFLQAAFQATADRALPEAADKAAED